MSVIQTHVRLEEVVGFFDKLEDPRSTINRQHRLSSVVVIALLAVLAGASGPTAIARWAALKEALLVKVLDLPYGAPRKDVFRRVLMLLKPAVFQSCFANWLQALRARAAEASGIEQPALPRSSWGRSGAIRSGWRRHDRRAVAATKAWLKEGRRPYGQTSWDRFQLIGTSI